MEQTTEPQPSRENSSLTLHENKNIQSSSTGITSSSVVQQQGHNPFASSSKPPPLHSADSVLDQFIVESSLAYASSKGAADASDKRDHKLCNHFLKRFRDSRRYRRLLRRSGEDALRLVDSIQDLLDSGSVDEEFRVILIVALTRFASKFELYPMRLMLRDVHRQEGPLTRGKSSFIGKGFYDGKLVCIKVLRPSPDLKSRSFNQLNNGGLGFISTFSQNGNVVDFLEIKPDTDRISLIIGAAAGMCYLHDTGLIHGGINGRNVLINGTTPPQACLSDYGLTNITDAFAIKSTDLPFKGQEGRTKQFLAPELLSPTISRRNTEASDVYAFSMTSYQILTGHTPFKDKSDYHVMLMVSRGERPLKPTAKVHQDRGLTDVVWQIMEESWRHDPDQRLDTRQIVERLSKENQEENLRRAEELHQQEEQERVGRELAEKVKKVTTSLVQILNDIGHYKCLLSSNTDDAQILLDTFQLLLDTGHAHDRGQLIAAMRRLSERTKLYPLRFLLQGSVPLLEDDPVASGNYADIYKVVFQDEKTCFKVIRVYQRSLVEHMAKCWDTASGIDYLHANDIVHGDLKGVNVLVEGSGRACLADFGLSSVTDPDIIHWTSQSSMASHGGTARWQAPELHETEDKVDTIHNSKESDVFAWANLCYEVRLLKSLVLDRHKCPNVRQIFTGRLPFFEALRESTVIMAILRGSIPTRPQGDDLAWLKHGLNDRLWGLLKDCWKFKPPERPDMRTVILRLGMDKPPDSRPPAEWERRLSTRFRNAQDTRLCEHMLPSLDNLDCILSRLVQANETGGAYDDLNTLH
ncbi:hypothetical protein DXG01_002394 [Tephrocybe rancida]|nr:hypothetical protein DXG01_002394 [Tephrocybe rancida]